MVSWDSDSFTDDLEKKMAANLEKAAIYYKGKVKEAINRSQPRHKSKGKGGIRYVGEDPSKPGEEPKKVTGFLQRSIAHEMSSDGKVAAVGTNLDYGLYLETGTRKMAARPYFRSTLLREQDVIANIITTGSR